LFEAVRPWQGRDLSESIRLIWAAGAADEVMGRFRHTLKTGEHHLSHDNSERRRDLGVTHVSDRQIQRITLPTGALGVGCFFTDIAERQRAAAAGSRIGVPAASNGKQATENCSRRAAETSLRESGRGLDTSLKEGRTLQIRTRRLSHRLLRAHEGGRKRIGCRRHDGITQPLVVINARLHRLTRSATVSPAALRSKIAGAGRVAARSIRVMHRFAHDLRPALFADLGLVPPLPTHPKEFSRRTEPRSRFTAFSGLDQTDGKRRTVLYRVARSLPADVVRHAGATRASVGLRKIAAAVRLEIHDNGKSFDEVGMRRQRKQIYRTRRFARTRRAGGRNLCGRIRRRPERRGVRLRAL